MGEILCEDCLDTGWLYDREGRYVCPCIAETEPYILLKAEIERLKTEYHETLQMAANQASAIKTQIEEIERLRAEILAQMTHIAQLQGEYDDRAGDAAE